MSRINAKDTTWVKVEVLGKEGLFTDERVDRNTIPNGWYFYEIRHDDDSWGDPIEIALGILVNFYGTFITKEPLKLIPSDITSNAYLDIDPEKDWKYLGEDMIKLEGSH